MEIDEVVARVVRRYWPLLLLMTLLPIPLVGYVVGGQPPAYTAQTRLQASSKATDAAPGDAGVSIVVSQVKAFATGRRLLDKVLDEQQVDRDPVQVAKKIKVKGLGTSTIVEMSVTDTDPETARKLTDAIGKAVVDEIDSSNLGAVRSQLDRIENDIKRVNGRLITATRRATFEPLNVSAANERERLASELSDLRADRSDLRTQLSTAGSASVVQPAVLAPQQNKVLILSVIASLIGLVLAILIAVVIEIFRPTVPGADRVARRLGAPLLGHVDRGPAELAGLGRRIRLAAKRAGVTRVTLVNTGPKALPADLISKVAAAVYGDATKVVQAEPPKPGTGTGTDESTDGGGPSADTDTDTDKIGRIEQGEDAGTSSGSSVVRSSAAVMTRRARELSEAAKSAPAPASARALCHVHAFEDFDPGSDDPVGVVAVAGPLTRLDGLKSVQDLISASGWPLLGVIATSRKIRG